MEFINIFFSSRHCFLEMLGSSGHSPVLQPRDNHAAACRPETCLAGHENCGAAQEREGHKEGRQRRSSLQGESVRKYWVGLHF